MNSTAQQKDHIPYPVRSIPGTQAWLKIHMLIDRILQTNRMKDKTI